MYSMQISGDGRKKLSTPKWLNLNFDFSTRMSSITDEKSIVPRSKSTYFELGLWLEWFRRLSAKKPSTDSFVVTDINPCSTIYAICYRLTANFLDVKIASLLAENLLNLKEDSDSKINI